QIENLLNRDEQEIFSTSLNSFIEYYSFEVQNLIEGNDYQLRNHPQNIVCKIQNKVKAEFLTDRNFIKAPKELENKIIENYDVLIRGKSLFALLTRILSHQNRDIKHSKMSLLEHCYKTHRSEKFIELIQKIRDKISA
ncbi:hypothetical protein, partial [Polaribacter sp.]|uniref:hypothetical protein n=1 Tax=Polaribacter sp. TaxID=1920175 RepID=UPI0035C7CD04